MRWHRPEEAQAAPEADPGCELSGTAASRRETGPLRTASEEKEEEEEEAENGEEGRDRKGGRDEDRRRGGGHRKNRGRCRTETDVDMDGPLGIISMTLSSAFTADHIESLFAACCQRNGISTKVPFSSVKRTCPVSTVRTPASEIRRNRTTKRSSFALWS